MFIYLNIYLNYLSQTGGHIKNIVRNLTKRNLWIEIWFISLHSFYRLNVVIDLIDNPTKQSTIQGLGESITHITRLYHVTISPNLFATCHMKIGNKWELQLLWLELQQLAHIAYDFTVFHLNRIVIGRSVLNKDYLSNQQNTY